MTLLVQKFGGTSLADLERIHHVAQRVAQAYHQGYQLVVVVSAMAGVTNQMVGWLGEAFPGNFATQAASDVVLSSGEQITCGLLTLALQCLGLPAKTWLGWQIPILTGKKHGDADIMDILATNLRASLAAGEIAVVAGFQGVTSDGQITTLGRGGSDTTAVALAAYLQAERCDIYTDVEGVYTADPRHVQGAKKLETLTYDEMLSLAASGAKVLHPRAVKFAKDYGVNLRVLSSLHTAPGTSISSATSASRFISGITHTSDYTQVYLQGLSPDWHFGLLEGVFSTHGCLPDMLSIEWDNAGSPHTASFALHDRRLSHLIDSMEKNKDSLGISSISLKSELAQLSLVKGSGWQDRSVARFKMIEAFEKAYIPFYAISTYAQKISFLVDQVHVHPLTYLLHQAYELHNV
ncbi:MAG: aspartate kinase [Alphaproteobacteria bacterium]